MYSNRLFFGSRNRAKLVNKTIRPIIDNLRLFILLLMFYKAIILVGFEQGTEITLVKIQFYKWLFTSVAVLYLLRSVICIGFKSFTYDFFIFTALGFFIFLLFTLNVDKGISLLNNKYFYSFLILGLFIFEFSRFDIRNVTLVLNPAQLFMLSFALLIIAGAALLELPNATTSPISFVDSLFTSTSAICVTGLIVVDTATQFTTLGKSIILLLIQVGGIGIMTFTSFFGFFFKGGTSSFSERLVLSDFFSEENIAEIRKTLTKVIFITLLFEIIGAAFLYFNLDAAYFPSTGSRIKFSVFHSVSAFCNAGFSTLTDGIYDYRTRGTYPILYVLGFLIILGGIGFPILLNLYTYIKYKFLSITSLIRYGTRKDFIPKMININSRLVIYTTIFLILTGAIFFFLFEHDHTLKGIDLSGKIAHSFFGSVTPRTAGFSSVNIGQLSTAAVVLTIFLMWVGASPVSTGGGIKTSTFAIAILNVLRIARVKNHIEFHKREIHERSVDRAFSIIILSIIILGCSSLIMNLIEPDKSALKILFECVSAFGTVGLSLGITPYLTDLSKLLLITLMFMGRMGILTLLFALFRKTKTSVYRYPKENIVIT
jgi:trk system potassium uptake protein TrkH